MTVNGRSKVGTVSTAHVVHIRIIRERIKDGNSMHIRRTGIKDGAAYDKDSSVLPLRLRRRPSAFVGAVIVKARSSEVLWERFDPKDVPRKPRGDLFAEMSDKAVKKGKVLVPVVVVVGSVLSYEHVVAAWANLCQNFLYALRVAELTDADGWYGPVGTDCPCAIILQAAAAGKTAVLLALFSLSRWAVVRADARQLLLARDASLDDAWDRYIQIGRWNGRNSREACHLVEQRIAIEDDAARSLVSCVLAKRVRNVHCASFGGGGGKKMRPCFFVFLFCLTRFFW